MELRDYLVQEAGKPDNGFALYLRVNLFWQYSFDELNELFRQIVKPKQMKHIVPEFPDFSTKPKLPRKDELDRYLYEYILHHEKGLKIEKIIEKVASSKKYKMASWKGKGRDSYVRRTVSNDLEKAKRIIEYTAYNIFPGHYDDTQEKKTGKKSATSKLIERYENSPSANVS